MKSDRSFAAPTKAKFFYEYLQTQLQDHDIVTPVLDEAFLATSYEETYDKSRQDQVKTQWMWPHYLPFFNEDETLKATIAKIHVNLNSDRSGGRRHKRRRH